MYRYAYAMIIPLFIAYFIISRFSGLPVWYSRNYIFIGLPFVLTGCYIAAHKKRMECFSNKTLLITVGAGLMTACAERFTGGYDLYFGNIIATAVVFIFAINNEEFTLGGPIEYVGTYLYFYCYIIHPFAIYFITAVGNAFKWTDLSWFMWIRPFTVFSITMLISQTVFYGLHIKEKTNDEKRV